jgi:SWI/SNF-related matrix-associated actin-dependent regulator 1 of chromatin subfamily A
VRRIWRFNGNALLADEMGLGKTLQALMFAHELGEGPILIICPAGAKWHWKNQAWEHIRLKAGVLEGRIPRRNWRPHTKCIIINYDILKKWIPLLRRMRPILTIVDECHKISNPRTQQTKHTRLLCRLSKYKILISGTPLTNRPAELFPALNILRPDRFPSFHSYAERYCRPQLKPWGWEYKGATHLEELHRRLRKWCMIRRLKSQVLKDLPAKTRSVIPLDITNKDRKEYEEAEANFVKWLSKKSRRLALRAAKAERLVKMGYLKRLAARLKMKQVIAWIDNFLQETDEKLLVFGIHKSVLRELYERYKHQSVIVTGEITGRKRVHAQDLFNKNKRYRLFFGNIDAAGVQWSCTSASTTLFVEIGWVPGKHTQAEDRTHGIKRGRKGYVSQSYYLVAKGTIEERLCELVQEKQRVLEETLDGIASDSSGLNIFDQLTELLAGSKGRQFNRRVS